MSSGTDISAMRSRRRTADWDLIYPILATIAAEACRMKGFVLLAVLLCATGTAAAQDAAVPPAKGIEAEPTSPPTEAAVSAVPGASSACQLRLAKLAEFQPLPVIAGPGECGAVDAVLLQSVILPDQAKVAVTPPATLRCTMAEEVARWLREDVARAALKLGAALRGLDEAGSYECRGFNRVDGATLSEHGRANALDVRALRLANGKVIGLTDVSIAKEWRDGLRTSACARFTTVLGPGSDSYHEEHIHLDLAERLGGYKLCQWDVREPIAQAEKTDPTARIAAKITEPVPLPRPRPGAAGSLGSSSPARHW
jgi:hypothetical protein